MIEGRERDKLLNKNYISTFYRILVQVDRKVSVLHYYLIYIITLFTYDNRY